jgi:hypothetical protein
VLEVLAVAVIILVEVLLVEVHLVKVRLVEVHLADRVVMYLRLGLVLAHHICN